MPNHAPALLTFLVLLTSLFTPLLLHVYGQVARLVIKLSERRRWPAWLAYTIGVLLNNVGICGWYLAFFLAGPTQITQPDYRLPQEGVLDATGRKLLATNLSAILMGLGVLAVAGTFKL